MDFFIGKKRELNHIRLLQHREIDERSARSLSNNLQVTSNFISRLILERELEGHEGCVNCLEWNESGEILASASDDMHVILWDPFAYQKKLTIQTGHTGNIFSVKFMPKSNDTILVTGAGDHKIRVHDIALSDIVMVCNCHLARVKRIAVAPSEPYLFWSSSEDGIIRQFDLRTQHTCKSDEEKTVLINLTDGTGHFLGTKCIAINPRRPELVAVGANDPYIRMYDRRMIKLSVGPNPLVMSQLGSPLEEDKTTDLPIGCAQYFIAGHLRKKDSSKKFATTYITFNDDGNELLANMGGEQIYLFDINNNSCSSKFKVPAESELNGETQNCDKTSLEKTGLIPDLSHLNVSGLHTEVEELKQKANTAFEKEQYITAINLYNEAISLQPTASILYANRAGTYMKRGWEGDVYAALRDSRIALALDPQHVKAYYRLAKCLYSLDYLQEAFIVIENFKREFPEYAHNSACKTLRKDIKMALDSCNESKTSKSEKLQITDMEKEWRSKAKDFKIRFCGHCNTVTDIKEANFFGKNGDYIVAGSDDGSFYVWDRYTTNILQILKGDQRIVNCLQPHPSMCLLATSGIDPVIRLWSPMPEDDSPNTWKVENSEEATAANQERMNNEHFDIMLFNNFNSINMGYRLRFENAESQDDQHSQPINCRPS